MDSMADSKKLINGRDLQEAWDENDDDDDDPATEPGSAPYESPTPKSESFCQKMRRLVVIEPYYMLFIVAGYPSYSLREQYFYYAVGQSMGINTNNLSGNVNETCGSSLNDTAYTNREAVQQRAAELNMYIELAVFLPSVISMLLYGAYSDKLGRKLLFILPPIGCCIDVAIQMCIIFFKLPVYVFYAATIGTILFGSSSLVYIAIYSYIADTVPPDGRATRMIIIDVIGKFLGGFVQLGLGYWIKESYFWPYCFVGGCYILSMLYGIFLIPETVQRDPMAKFNVRDVGRAFQLYVKDNGSRRRWKLWVLTLSLMVEILFLMAFGVFTLFEMNAPLCWNSVMIGYYGAARDTVEAVGGVVGMFFKRCMADHWMALLGKVTFTTELLYLAFVQTTLMMYFGK
jgi:MFS family permease